MMKFGAVYIKFNSLFKIVVSLYEFILVKVHISSVKKYFWICTANTLDSLVVVSYCFSKHSHVVLG